MPDVSNSSSTKKSGHNSICYFSLSSLDLRNYGFAALGVVLICLILLTSIFVFTTPMSSNYTIFVDSTDANKTKAKNSITGTIDFSGADSAWVLQKVVDSLATRGGSILLKRGVYVWQSVPALPKDLPNWLKIFGEGGVTIQLSLNGPRAFDFRKTADYDTFRNIWLENLTIDCNNVGGRHHVVLGTYQDGTVQTRINLQNITIRNIATKNVPVDSTLANHRLNVWLVAGHLATGETQTNITNILVENCDFRGGNMGVVIGGHGPDATGIKVFIDAVEIRKCRHSLLSVQSSYFPSANFIVGGQGFGGYAHIADCYGEYSGDVGVEVNSVDALVENTVIRDAVAFGFYLTNYNVPRDGKNHVKLLNCIAKKATLTSNLESVGYGAYSSGPPGPAYITIENCEYNSERASKPNPISGLALDVVSRSGMSQLFVNNFKVLINGFDKTDPSSSQISAIRIWPTGFATIPSVMLQNIDIVMNGTRKKDAGDLYVSALDLKGMMTFLVDNATVSVNVAGVQRSGIETIALGRDQASILEGTVRRYKLRQVTGDLYPYGIVVSSTATLTINGQIRIENCDFSGMANGVAVQIDPTNRPYVSIA